MASNHCIVSLERKAESVLAEIDSYGEELRYLWVEHSGFDKPGESLIQISHRHRHIYHMLIAIAQRGFMIYMAKNSASRFVRDSALRVIWPALRNNVYQQYRQDVIYTLDTPAPMTARHLIVIFSDISNSFQKTSLSRYFSNSLGDVQERLPSHAAILRIGDVGGVSGTAHFGNSRSANHLNNIRDLIEGTSNQLNLSAEDITCTGIGTGGVAAIFHGSLGGYSQVVAAPSLPSCDLARPWHNPCFLDGEKIQSSIRFLSEGARPNQPRNYIRCIVGGQGRGGEPFDDRLLQGSSHLHIDPGTASDTSYDSLSPPLYTALSLRVLGADVASLDRTVW